MFSGTLEKVKGVWGPRHSWTKTTLAGTASSRKWPKVINRHQNRRSTILLCSTRWIATKNVSSNIDIVEGNERLREVRLFITVISSPITYAFAWTIVNFLSWEGCARYLWCLNFFFVVFFFAFLIWHRSKGNRVVLIVFVMKTSLLNECDFSLSFIFTRVHAHTHTHTPEILYVRELKRVFRNDQRQFKDLSA